MSSFHLHPEYTSTQIHHISLYYILQRQENLPETHSISDSTVASNLSLRRDLFKALCDVLTISALIALCTIFFPKKNQLNLCSLGQLFLSCSHQFWGSLLTVRQFFCTSICYIPVTYYLGTAHPLTSFFSARKHSYRCSLSDSQLEISLPLRKIDKRQKQGKRTISVNKRFY
jgi:hypothetical protein